jgi:hypothetical protein
LELLERSATALAIAKRSFSAKTESIRGVSSIRMQARSLYYDTEESKEGGRTFREKRKPNFRSQSGWRRQARRTSTSPIACPSGSIRPPISRANGVRSPESFGATTQQWLMLGALTRGRLEAAGMTVKQQLAFHGVSRENLNAGHRPACGARLDRARRWWNRWRAASRSPDRSQAWRRMQAPIGAFYASALQELSRAGQG